jgi:hypothetical protein
LDRDQAILGVLSKPKTTRGQSVLPINALLILSGVGLIL